MWCAAVLVGLCLCSGCGRGDGRSELSGTVTFDGEPVDGGSIAFLPIDDGAETRSKPGARIEAGKYHIPAAKGAMPGKYRVEIHWPKKTGKKVPFDDPPTLIDETREVVPAKYNRESTLTVDVTQATTEFGCEMKSK
jgi:hypothetical protein